MTAAILALLKKTLYKKHCALVAMPKHDRKVIKTEKSLNCVISPNFNIIAF